MNGTCVFSQMTDIKHIRWDFHSFVWIMSQGWDLGMLGGGGQKFDVLNMVMWLIKLKGMIDRPRTQEILP